MMNSEENKSNAKFDNKSPEMWDSNGVFEWLRSIGLQEYANLLINVHKIDGPLLLTLKESDLREKPLEIKCLGVIKRLNAAICDLRREFNINPKKYASDDHHIYLLLPTNRQSVSYLDNSTSTHTIASNVELENLLESSENDIQMSAVNGLDMAEKTNVKLPTKEELIRKVESPDTKGKSLFKLAVAFIYCTLSLLITAFALVLVHDRVPDMKTYPPLPDIVLDNLPLIPWAFEMCEFIAVFLTFIWFTILFFHKHRVVIMRRMFSLVGTVFLLRCVTTLITSLSVPGVHLECRAKNYDSLSMKLWEAYRIWSRLGMSIHGVRSCGDYMFSGHTTAITLLNHFITEYTPDTWHLLHTITWVLNLFGIFFILAGHEHYSIDVFIAFYISSRMFLYYHAYAYHHYSSNDRDGRMRLWFPLGWFFEAGGQGRVRNEFDFPISIPSKQCKKFNGNGTKRKEQRKNNCTLTSTNGIKTEAGRNISLANHSRKARKRYSRKRSTDQAS